MDSLEKGKNPEIVEAIKLSEVNKTKDIAKNQPNIMNVSFILEI